MNIEELELALKENKKEEISKKKILFDWHNLSFGLENALKELIFQYNTKVIDRNTLEDNLMNMVVSKIIKTYWFVDNGNNNLTAGRYLIEIYQSRTNNIFRFPIFGY
jgi:hypothetical protein